MFGLGEIVVQPDVVQASEVNAADLQRTLEKVELQ